MATFLTIPTKEKFIWVINSDVMASSNPEKNIAKGSHLHCKEIKLESIESDRFYVLQYEIEGEKFEIIRHIKIDDGKYYLTCNNPEFESENLVLDAEEMNVFTKISLVFYKETYL
jgi:hypothetical protein